MRRGWVVAALGMAILAVAGCGGGSGGDAGAGAASERQVCDAAEQAMTDHGTGLQEALTRWDGSPENVATVTDAADRWAQAIGVVAADASDDELRAMLESLATEVERFGAGWRDSGTEPDLAAIEAAVQPLDDRCGFGAGVVLTGGATSTADVCAAALAEAGSAAFDEVAAAAGEVDRALATGDRAALDAAITELDAAAREFAQRFREVAAAAENASLRTAVGRIAGAVESWAASVRDGQPADLGGFREAVRALDGHCE